MKIATWNVNGLKSSVRSGLNEWLAQTKSDIVCLQEAKSEQDLLSGTWFPGYEAYWAPAARPGYSGVVTAVASHIKPYDIIKGLNNDLVDQEGRVLTVELADVQIVNAYAPHSHRQLKRVDFKLFFLDRLRTFLGQRKQIGKPIILVGDLNIAHKEIDVANFAANRKNAGFLPQERAWLDLLISEGFHDAFRMFTPEAGHYTWWSPIKGVRERNIGWRLDYVLIEEPLRARLAKCYHSPEQRGSDHCPVTAEFL